MTSSADENVDSSLVSVDGAKEPEKIPFHVKYSFFFEWYEQQYRPYLDAKLSAADQSKLSAAAADHGRWREAENARGHKQMVELCSRAFSMRPLQYIKKREKSAETMNKRMAADYRKTLKALSPSAQKEIRNFVNSEIVPTLSGDIVGTPLWETMSEEDAKRARQIDCYYIANGEYPPEVQEEMNRAMSEIMEQALQQEEKE